MQKKKSRQPDSAGFPCKRVKGCLVLDNLVTIFIIKS